MSFTFFFIAIANVLNVADVSYCIGEYMTDCWISIGLWTTGGKGEYDKGKNAEAQLLILILCVLLLRTVIYWRLLFVEFCIDVLWSMSLFS